MMDFVTPGALVSAIADAGVSHVIYLPDSEHRATHDLLVDHASIELIRICREGESFAIAAGLIAGGRRPLVMIQNTGMFESGDSIRGLALAGGGLPIVAMIGYRGWVAGGNPGDSAAVFTEPILSAWGLPYRLITTDAELGRLAECFAAAESTGRPQATLIVEDELYASTQRDSEDGRS